MKNSLIITFLLLTLGASAQQLNLSRLDVEKLNGKIDLNQDISSYSLSDLRILRNAFSARQGYCFMNADLRGIFGSTSWYEKVLEERFWDSEEYDENGEKNANQKKMAPISYTKEEQAFMTKLKAREDELKANNFPHADGQLVNIANIVNPFQLTTFDERLQKALSRQGFAIVPGEDDQLFHIYERNDYHNFPNFVTTDLFLQAFHMYFDCLLRDVEEQRLLPVMTDFSKTVHQEMSNIALQTKNPELKAAAEYDMAFFAIAHALLTGKLSLAVPAAYKETVAEEIAHVKEAGITYSEFLGYTPKNKMPKYFYSTYRPRGHYTRSDSLKRYFMGMMWLQSAPFGTEMPKYLKSALLIADVIGKNDKLRQLYETVNEPITFLMGQTDNVSLMQVYQLMKQQNLPLETCLKKKRKLAKIRQFIEELDETQTRIKPKFISSSKVKLNVIPQRYQPDAEVLQEMVDYDSKPTLRPEPTGLDVLAAIGIQSAERILLKELNEQERWNKYEENLQRMKQRMSEIDWNCSVANRWIASTKDINAVPEGAPYFMKTPQWDKKTLNSALASWAELKHDAILYAKQPFGAECGGYGVPEPITRGYVEPNIAYWTKAIELIDATNALLQKYNLTTEKSKSCTEELRDKAEFLLNCSQKELAGKRLSDEEYRQVEAIGSAFEYITLHLIQQKDEYLNGWDAVEGADKKIALVADVYTANADNNPNPAVVYEAVGPAHEIYVVVEIEGYLYLTRGAVFSYREFHEALDTPRLTDEEWQEQLKTNSNKGIPEWMKEIIVPLNGKSLDNEKIFYSSGC